MYGWIKPFRPSFITTLDLIQPLNLLLKYGENGSGRIAGSEPGGEWMCEEILLCAFFVRIQCIIDY